MISFRTPRSQEYEFEYELSDFLLASPAAGAGQAGDYRKKGLGNCFSQPLTLYRINVTDSLKFSSSPCHTAVTGSHMDIADYTMIELVSRACETTIERKTFHVCPSH